MLSDRMEELEEVSKELLKVLQSDWADNLLRHGLDKQSRMDDKLLSTQATAAQLVRELTVAEEKVAQTLLDQENKLERCLQRLQDLEEEVVRVREAGANLQTSTNALRQELEELQKENRKLDEDMEQKEEAMPPAAYVTQLYYKISHIDWDYEAEPTHIKGIHYGPDIAQPITIDSGRHSRCFVSDYLWSLVPTEW